MVMNNSALRFLPTSTIPFKFDLKGSSVRRQTLKKTAVHLKNKAFIAKCKGQVLKDNDLREIRRNRFPEFINLDLENRR